MKYLFATLIFCSAAFAHAEGILLKSSSVSAKEFDSFLADKKDLISYVDHYYSKLLSNSSQEQRLFALGDSVEQNISDVLRQVENIQMEFPQTEISLKFSHDFAEKLKPLAKTAGDKDRVEKLFCKSLSLQKDTDFAGCHKKVLDLRTLKLAYPQAEYLLIETQKISLKDQTTIEIAANVSYFWTLLSNAHKPVTYYGTFDQLLLQNFSFDNLVDGSCEGFSASVNDFEVNQRGLIFFNKACLKKLDRTDNQSSFSAWVSDNRKWLYTAGVILGGAAIAYTMKDKTIVMDR
jgi:hypothetical protein